MIWLGPLTRATNEPIHVDFPRDAAWCVTPSLFRGCQRPSPDSASGEGRIRRAGVTHRRYRGMHGFRRAVAGDVARSTGNLKLAMEYIGDTDIRRAREYIQVRPDHLREAASIMDRDRSNRPQTVPEPGVASEGGPELVAAGGSTELPRQDSNLRPVA
jgi:hypothetical protein